MPDRCRALKIETPSEGGTQNDALFGPTEIDVGQDYLDSQGTTYQRPNANTQTADSKVYVTRTSADDLTLNDPNAGLLALQQLITSVSGRLGSHNTLMDLGHWSSFPGDGFASGAYLVVTQSGILPSAWVWYASSAANAAKLFSVSVTYSGIRPQTIVQRLYTANAVVRTFTDTLSYNNQFYPTVTRTWT